jgi:hypothetical protein
MGGPAWKGEGYFDNISLVGAPNGGSLLVMNSLLNGMSLSASFKINIPFVMDLTKYDVFTIPSIYQLLPHEGLLRAYDEDLNKIDVDIYDVETWKKYGWLAYDSEKFIKEFSAEEQSQAGKYFQTVLRRAKLFQAALNASSNENTSVRFYNFVAECKPTIDGMVVYKDRKTGSWKTLLAAQSFKKSDGTNVSKKLVKKAVISPGDGQVSDVSLIYSFTKPSKPAGGVKAVTTICGHHSLQVENKEVRKSILEIFNLPVNGSAK